VVVLQFRYDGGPDPFLARYFAYTQPFQLPGVHTLEREWVLWLPEGDKLHQHVQGPIESSERVVQNARRLLWSGKNLPAIIPEPNMPHLLDVVAQVTVSTVPSWDLFLKWEAGLLREAFEESSAIKVLAKKIMPEGISAQEKVLRVHRYVQEEIKYEQDYENSTAGVKPHRAPVVFARRYGDCKDKAVLFITLARVAGVHAHFAILKTTSKGRVLKDVPMQQFNHAIVYVPPQPGIAEGRFYDPTADALDLHILRTDDVGAWSLVYDPVEGSSQWLEIPLPEKNDHSLKFHLDIALNADGSGKASLDMVGTGLWGAAIRRFVRNPKLLDKFVDSVTGRIYPGASTDSREVVEAADLRAPAHLRWSFDAPGVARKEGKTLVWRAPIESMGRSSAAFVLLERVYPLILGFPRMEQLTVTLKAPKGWRVREAPGDAVAGKPCFSMERISTRSKREVTLRFKRQMKCSRIEAEGYVEYGILAKEMDQLFEGEVVFSR
jgi:hypothetical protein